MKTIVLTAVALSAAIVQAAACKFPGCKESAITKSQFCDRHTCDTEGCFAGVKIGGIPAWVEGGKKNRNNFYGEDSKAPELPTKIVWKHCPKHMCGRFCPRLNNARASSLIQNKSEDEILQLLGCPNERLNKGKYCLEHSCALAKCPSLILEEWSAKAKSNKDESDAPEWNDLGKHEFCFKHLSLKDKNPHPREGVNKETCSEYVKRVREEKAAAAADAAEKKKK